MNVHLGLFGIVLCCNAALAQFTDTSSLNATSKPDPEMQELKLLVQTLQQQVAAIHSTLLTQQTMSIDQVCKAIEHIQSNGAGATIVTGPKDCVDIQKAGHTTSGVYSIRPPGESQSISVYCDMTTDGGGWLLIQKRTDGSVDFYKTFSEYEVGFGNATGELYLGNRNIHAISSSGRYELLVELEDFQKHVKTAHYTSFALADRSTNYRLSVDGFNGTAGDSLKFNHDGHEFSASDVDHDTDQKTFCAQKHHGGYWYSDCFKSNINGKWGVPGEQGIIWGSFKDWTLYVLKRTEMKIRPLK